MSYLGKDDMRKQTFIVVFALLCILMITGCTTSSIDTGKTEIKKGIIYQKGTDPNNKIWVLKTEDGQEIEIQPTIVPRHETIYINENADYGTLYSRPWQGNNNKPLVDDIRMAK